MIVKEKPELKDPIIICGLPGSAFVGKFAVDHLILQLGAKPLVEIYCDGFPPQIMVKDDGSVSLLRNDAYYWRNEQDKCDLILYTGDAQPSTPEAEYALSERMVDFFINEHHTRRLITLGAYVTGSFAENPRVFAAATDAALASEINRAGVTLMADGGITGMNGLLLGIARIKGMSGYTLLGETSGYVLDAKASQAVLISLSKLINVRVDMQKLEERVKQSQEVLQALEKMRRQKPQSEGEEQTERKTRLDYIS